MTQFINDNNYKINKLILLANKLGGRVLNISHDKFKKIFGENKYSQITGWSRPSYLSLAPFAGFEEDLGIDWNNKIVYFCDSRKSIHWGGILHEMGHVFCSEVRPVLSEEFNFLGWEYFIARKLNGIREWFTYNADYVVSENGIGTFNSILRKDLIKILDKQIEFAKKNKLIINNQPVSIR